MEKLQDAYPSLLGLLPTGVPAVDELCGGLFVGGVTLLSGGASVGKTTLCLEVARKLCRTAQVAYLCYAEHATVLRQMLKALPVPDGEPETDTDLVTFLSGNDWGIFMEVQAGMMEHRERMRRNGTLQPEENRPSVVIIDNFDAHCVVTEKNEKTAMYELKGFGDGLETAFLLVMPTSEIALSVHKKFGSNIGGPFVSHFGESICDTLLDLSTTPNGNTRTLTLMKARNGYGMNVAGARVGTIRVPELRRVPRNPVSEFEDSGVKDSPWGLLDTEKSK